MSDPFDSSGDNSCQPTPGPFGAPPSPPSGQPFQPPTQPVYSNPPQTPVYGDTNVTELVEGATPPRRSRGKMVGALVGVAALLGAGIFAITQISDDSSNGGAATPQEVGDKLIKSLDGEDLLGVVDLLLPGERTTFRQPLVDLNNELKRLEITDGSVDLNKVPGFDIVITDTKVRERKTNVDDISTVMISGTAAVTVDGEQLPIGDLLIDSAFGGERPDADASEEEEDFTFALTTVKQDGNWYLSLLYTAAQQAVGDQDIPEEGVLPAGADSPEGALENLLRAAADLNLEAIIAGLNPNEVSALQRYAPLFLDDAQEMLDDVDASIEVGDAQFKVSGSGDRRQVSVTAITVDAKQGEDELTFELKDGCFTISSRGESFASCTGEADGGDALDDALGQLDLPETDELATLIEDLQDALSDFEMHGIVVDKVDGKWYVSPIGTGSELILSVLRALDRDEIDTIINDVGPAFDSLFGAFDDDFPEDEFPEDTTFDTIPEDTTFDTIPDDTTFDTIPDDTTFDTIPDDTTFDTFPDDTTFDTTDIENTTNYFDCLYVPADETAACIQAGIDDGRFNRDDIPGPYQFPDCGLFEYYNGSDIYDDSPEEFQNVIEPALPCIVEAAAEAGVDLTYSSPEFAHPECFVGVNPYNYSGDDSDAIGDAYECAFAAS